MMDAGKPYLEDIKKLPLLTAKEEISLANKIKRGDKVAREKMIQSNQRLIGSIAKKFMIRGLSFADLLEEGELGLINAVDGFNPKKGYRFSTYATLLIKQSILSAIHNSHIVKLPNHVNKMISKIRRAQEDLIQQNGKEPTPEEIAHKMRMPVDKVRGILKIAQEPISLQTPIGDEGDTHFGDFIEDKNTIKPGDDEEEYSDNPDRVLKIIQDEWLKIRPHIELNKSCAYCVKRNTCKKYGFKDMALLAGPYERTCIANSESFEGNEIWNGLYSSGRVRGFVKDHNLFEHLPSCLKFINEDNYKSLVKYFPEFEVLTEGEFNKHQPILKGYFERFVSRNAAPSKKDLKDIKRLKKKLPLLSDMYDDLLNFHDHITHPKCAKCRKSLKGRSNKLLCVRCKRVLKMARYRSRKK